MTNQQAMSQLLGLWDRYRRGQELGHGNTKWRDLFDFAKDIRRWGARDRLRPEVLVAWAEEGEAASVPFRLELWFRDDGHEQEAAVGRAIDEAGGQGLGDSPHRRHTLSRTQGAPARRRRASGGGAARGGG